MAKATMRSVLLRAVSVSTAALACSDGSFGSGEPNDQLLDLAAKPAALTRFTAATLWDPEDPIDACFLADGTDLPVHEEWIRADIHRTWEFVSNITVNWLSSCPSTGSLVRIGLKGRANPSDGEDGWANGHGMGTRRDQQATANANVNSPDALKPSFKLYLQPDPENSNRSRVGYLGIHEFGHVLGFAHEQNHPDSSCTESVGDTQTAITAYDGDSIMNYCAPSTQDWLSRYDREGAQAVYGVGARYEAAQASSILWTITSIPVL